MKKLDSMGRRKALGLLAVGAAGVAIGATALPKRVFARRHLGKGAEAKLPPMIYDPDLQMMVDPETGKPIYDNAGKFDVATAIVTTNCGDCPKNDGCSDNYAC